MPIFDYKCDKCGKVIEKFVKASTEEVWCPACDSPMHKEIGKSNFILKGDGWYKPSPQKNRGEP